MKTILRKLRIPTSSTNGMEASHWLDNKDLRPTPIQDRKWQFWTYSVFWLAAAANLSNWFSPTSFMTVGLSMWEALACHLGGQFLAGVSMVFTGRPGAVYHVGFPVIARCSFGVFGAMWPIINRAVMSIIWNGVNMVQGAQCVYLMLHSIFPSIADLPNGMKSTDALNTGGMIGFVIFFVILAFCLMISTPKLRFFLFAKLIFFVISAVALLAWTLSLAGGIGDSSPYSSNLNGKSRAWLIVRFTLISWANCSTFIVNAADYQRYVNKANNVIFGQIVGFPLSNFIIGLVGVIIGTTSSTVVGHFVWNPVLYVDAIMVQNYTAGPRAAAFFIGLCFAISGVFSCIFENILPAGNDLAAIAPRYINIKRGQYICLLLSIACVPWKLLGTATQFISWLSAYQIFLSSITGIMMAHYYVLSKGYLKLEPDTFITGKGGIYWYTSGFNIRSYLAYILGIIPNFYGFLGNVGLNITLPAQRMYYFAYPIGIFVSFVSFYLLTIIKPPRKPPGKIDHWSEPKDYVSVLDQDLVLSEPDVIFPDELFKTSMSENSKIR